MVAEVDFPLNLPIMVRQRTVCGKNPSDYLGHSISGVGAYLALFEKKYPDAEKCFLPCIGDGMGKRSVKLIATIIFTALALPYFCGLGILYNVVAGSVKTWFGVLNFLAKFKEEEEAPSGAKGQVDAKKTGEDPMYVQLFKGATQHFCFVGLDLVGEITALKFLFVGAFAFDGQAVRERFRDLETNILTGAPYRKMVEWGQELGWGQFDSIADAAGSA